MGWLIAVLVILAIIFFAVPRYRVIILVLMMASLGLGYIIYHESQREATERARKEHIAETLVKASDLEMTDFKISPPPFEGMSGWTIKGVVKNNSEYDVESISLNIVVRNCDTNKTNCVVIGSGTALAWRINIPKGQVRNFDEAFKLERMPKLENWDWSVTVKSIVAMNWK